MESFSETTPVTSASQKPYDEYPGPEAIDAFCDELKTLAKKATKNIIVEHEAIPPYTTQYMSGQVSARGTHFVKITTSAENNLPPFYCLWQPVSPGSGDRKSTRRPLLVHTPGYAGTMHSHPDLQANGYNILHVNPLGLNSPSGFDATKMRPLTPTVLSTFEEGAQKKDPLIAQLYRSVGDTGVPAVLFDTIDSDGAKGYKQWLLSCLVAVQWAKKQKTVDSERIATFGTSQGGGGSLLLASILSSRAISCCAADQPFLTDLKTLVRLTDACHPVTAEFKFRMMHMEEAEARKKWWHLGFYDTLSHAHRLVMPCLLTSGSADYTCPAESISNLYARLPSTRSLTEEKGRSHGGMVPFHRLAL
jgi:cephalosporin-C deacetylase-like acetyl esterase